MMGFPPAPAVPSRTCFAVHPDYQQFPPTCKLMRDHEGPHEAGNQHYGGPIKWHDRETR